MPPAISDDGSSDELKQVLPRRPWAKDSDAEESDVGKKRGGRRSRRSAPAQPEIEEHEQDDDEKEVEEGEDDDEEGDEDGEADEEGLYEVERIENHMVKNNAIVYFVKWEKYDSDENTWEPEINLESAQNLVDEYLQKVGGRDKILAESKAAKGKKRGRPSAASKASESPIAPTTKRSRRNGTHPADLTPPESAKKWSPPAGSWEEHIDTIDAHQDDETGRVVVYLTWKTGQKTKHETTVVYKKCPQKMLQFYERHITVVRE